MSPADLLPPRGWPGVPGDGRLPVFLSVPTEDGEGRGLHDLHWPPEATLPRLGDHLTRQTYRSHPDGPSAGPTRIVTWLHVVLRYEWRTRPAHGSITHPTLDSLVLLLSEGEEVQ